VCADVNPLTFSLGLKLDKLTLYKIDSLLTNTHTHTDRQTFIESPLSNIKPQISSHKVIRNDRLVIITKQTLTG